MLLSRLALSWSFCLLGATLLSTPLCSQSKYAPIFEKFQRTGDQSAFLKELFEPTRQSLDPRVEVPVLLEVISTSTNPESQEQARGHLCMMAFNHPLEGEIFRPAIAVFERHLDAAEK